MRAPVRSTAFKKDVKRMAKRGKDMTLLKNVISRLLDGNPLEPRHGDHPLKGEWTGYRDLHVEPDWLLLYRVSADEVFLARTGTHAELFGG